MGSERECCVCVAYGFDGLEGRPAPAQWEYRAVCEECRSQFRRNLASLVEQHALLDATPGVVEQERVSGTREKSLKVRAAVLDQLVPATDREREPDDPHGDVCGHVPLAQALNAIAEYWRTARFDRFAEREPALTVANLATWIEHRLDWACEHIPEPVAAAVELLHPLVGHLYALNGRSFDRGQIIPFTPCPGCDVVGSLMARAGDDRVRCTAHGCRYTSTRADVERWTGLLAASKSLSDQIVASRAATVQKQTLGSRYGHHDVRGFPLLPGRPTGQPLLRRGLPARLARSSRPRCRGGDGLGGSAY